MTRATIVNGIVVSNNTFYPNVAWDIQGYSFEHALITMEIGVWDMILAVWMTQYSLITFDFKYMQVRLYIDDCEIVLEEMVQQPAMKPIRGKGFRKFAAQRNMSMSSI